MAAGRYIALLRGINVGTAKRVAMAELRALVEELGYSEVRTLLNSGNVVFSAPRAEPRAAALRIQKAMETKLGVSARVTVISAEELAEVVAENPLGKIADNPSRLLAGILSDPADREKLEEIARKDWGKERIALAAGAAATGGAAAKGAARAVYMWMPQGVIASKLNAAVSKALGDRVTSRNWATMLKLKEMTEE
ncbi:MAG: DUF1697 domain-containing protein [Spirochaetia bacterium]